MNSGIFSTKAFWAAVLVLLVAGTLVHPYMAQQASRYALTAAVVERGTVQLDAYERVLGIDKAAKDGHLYSDKAPGQPLLAVPFFAVGKLFGVEDATILRIDGNLGLWWVTFWCSSFAGALLVVLMIRRATVVEPEAGVAPVLAVFFGTMLLPFSALLFGHVTAAAFLFASYVCLEARPHPAGWRRATLAGLFAGLAVLTEYTAALGVIVLFGVVLWRHRRSWWQFVAGGVPPALVLGVYNHFAFGAWYRLSYQYTAFSGVRSEARGFFESFSSPAAENLLALFLHGRGLLVATPVVLIAVAGAATHLRKRDVDSVVAVAMFAAFLLLPFFWENPWGGDSPGPRYMTPLLPFLTVPFVRAWRRWRLLAIASMAVSVVTMLAATLTNPFVHRDDPAGLGLWLTEMLEGRFVPTLFTMAAGPAGWLLHLALAAGALVMLGRAPAPGRGVVGAVPGHK
nr:MAG: hypothetical protein DIU67_08675 [Actinomycetota bacterium]